MVSENPRGASGDFTKFAFDAKTARLSKKDLLANNLSRLLTSPEYSKFIHTFMRPERGAIIGVTLEYGVLHPDLFGINAFLQTIQRGGRFVTDNAFAHSIAQRLQVDQDTQRGKEAIFDYYIDQTQTQGVYYHGFNGVFEDQIREHGLSVERRMWDWDEVKEAERIGKKAGKKTLLGFAGINSEGKLYFSESAMHTYSYAARSPEWFESFVSGHTDDSDGQNAYENHDYEVARQNVITLLDRMQSSRDEEIAAGTVYTNISTADRTYLMEFFEKHWRIFTGPKSNPAAAFIEKDAVDEIAPDILNFESFCQEHLGGSTRVPVADAIGLVRLRKGDFDIPTTKSIPPDKITIVELPNYKNVMV